MPVEIIFMVWVKFFVDVARHHTGNAHIVFFFEKQFFGDKPVKFVVRHFTNGIQPNLMFKHQRVNAFQFGTDFIRLQLVYSSKCGFFPEIRTG